MPTTREFSWKGLYFSRMKKCEVDSNAKRMARAKVTASFAGTVLGLSKYATPHVFLL